MENCSHFCERPKGHSAPTHACKACDLLLAAHEERGRQLARGPIASLLPEDEIRRLQEELRTVINNSFPLTPTSISIHDKVKAYLGVPLNASSAADCWMYFQMLTELTDPKVRALLAVLEEVPDRETAQERERREEVRSGLKHEWERHTPGDPFVKRNFYTPQDNFYDLSRRIAAMV